MATPHLVGDRPRGRLERPVRRPANPIKPRPPFYFRTPELKDLSSSEERLSLARLGLSTRAINSLNLAGIRTIGQLVESAYDGMNTPRATGQRNVVDIQNALKALSQSIRRGGHID